MATTKTIHVSKLCRLAINDNLNKIRNYVKKNVSQSADAYLRHPIDYIQDIIHHT